VLSNSEPFFLDGQGVHVGAQADGRPVAALDASNDAGLGDFGFGLDAQADQFGVDQPRGAMLGKAQLRVAMDFPPPGLDFGLDGFGARVEFGAADGIGI